MQWQLNCYHLYEILPFWILRVLWPLNNNWYMLTVLCLPFLQTGWWGACWLMRRERIWALIQCGKTGAFRGPASSEYASCTLLSRNWWQPLCVPLMSQDGEVRAAAGPDAWAWGLPGCFLALPCKRVKTCGGRFASRYVVSVGRVYVDGLECWPYKDTAQCHGGAAG